MNVRALSFLLVPFAVPCAHGAGHAIFDSVPLDGDWEMSYRSNAWDSAECPGFSGRVVAGAVPGFWEDMVPAFRRAGIGDVFAVNPLYERQEHPISGSAQDTTLPKVYGCFLYRRTVRLERGGPAELAFTCVRNQVHAWVNGRFVAFHQGFSTPFALSIPDGVLRRGDNEVTLAVSNNPNDGYAGTKTSGLTTRSTFASTGGLAGHVELRFPRNALSGAYVTTAADLKSFTVHVSGGVPFAYEVRSASGASLASGKASGDFTLPTDGFALWSPESPVLHELELRTPEGSFRQRFGLRRLLADGERLTLNGRPVYLRGVTEHCYFPETLHLPRDAGYYRRLAARRRELGFNFVRFHTYVPPEEHLAALDEFGLLAHVESPNFVTVDEYRGIVEFARRHPCAVIYCTGNETRIDRMAEAYLREVADVVHGGTDALFSPMSALRGFEYQLMPGLDDIVEKPFRHNPARAARLAEFCDLFSSYQLGAVSYESLNGPSAAEIDEWGDAYCGRPRLSHEICIDGAYLDLSLEAMYPPGSPLVKTGLFSGVRRMLAEKGLLDRAGAYFRHSSEWMRRIRKFTFEKMRASRRTAGYDFLGDVNTHWHTFGYSVGMMDEFLRLKPGETVENVLMYNSAAVILSDLGSDFNVTAGETKRVAFSISNYAGDAPSACLQVALVDANTAESVSVASASWPDTTIPNGRVSPLKTLAFAFPESAEPRKYILKAEFSGGPVSARNEWEIYAFPKVAAPQAAPGVRIADDMTLDALVSAMERGERVLLTGAGPFRSLPTSYRIGLAGRCGGNYATIVEKGHPALEGLPHDGFCGWQFRRLMEGGRAVQLEAGVPFGPIVEVASSDKFVVRQAMLFEYRVGAGRLLVCSFKFGGGDPAAAWLLSRLVEYAGSDAFAPRLSLTPGQLRAVATAPLLDGGRNTNKARNPSDPSSLVRAGPLAQP